MNLGQGHEPFRSVLGARPRDEPEIAGVGSGYSYFTRVLHPLLLVLREIPTSQPFPSCLQSGLVVQMTRKDKPGQCLAHSRTHWMLTLILVTVLTPYHNAKSQSYCFCHFKNEKLRL